MTSTDPASRPPITLAADAARLAATGDGSHDFDFIHGAWRIHNRRLRDPLTGLTEWYEFEGHSVERPLWDGQANLEEFEATLPDSTRLRGLALRLYDPNARRWTIHWSNGATGTLDPPMTGAFRDGVGEFYSHEEYQGRMILVRFHWRSLGPSAARWEQAFSADGGRTWETNWVMEFTGAGEVGDTGAADSGSADAAPGTARVRVRRATPADLDLVTPLFDAYRMFYGQSPDPVAARAFLAARMSRDESVVLLASLDASSAAPDGDVVGFAQLYRSFSSVSLGTTVILNDLFVSPSARRLGVAGRLVDGAAAYARQTGAVRLELATQHANEPALGLYRAKGFGADTQFAHLSLPLGSVPDITDTPALPSQGDAAPRDGVRAHTLA